MKSFKIILEERIYIESGNVISKSELKALINNSKMATAGGYFTKNLLINPIPSVILLTRDNYLSVYELSSGGDAELYRTVRMSNITIAHLSEGIITVLVNHEPNLSLLLSEKYRNQILRSTQNNVFSEYMLAESATTNNNSKIFPYERKWMEIINENRSKERLKINPVKIAIILAIVFIILFIIYKLL